jgi:hypothetical protein
MENRWLMTLLLASVLWPTAAVADAYSLYWSILEEDAGLQPAEPEVRS